MGTHVIVSPGFLGNVVLKTLEGISEVASDLARDAYTRKFAWKLGLSLVSRELRALKRITDWKYYGGAPLLGFDRVVIKAHGRSNARAIHNALKVAHKAIVGNIAESGLIWTRCPPFPTHWPIYLMPYKPSVPRAKLGDFALLANRFQNPSACHGRTASGRIRCPPIDDAGEGHHERRKSPL